MNKKYCNNCGRNYHFIIDRSGNSVPEGCPFCGYICG